MKPEIRLIPSRLKILSVLAASSLLGGCVSDYDDYEDRVEDRIGRYEDHAEEQRDWNEDRDEARRDYDEDRRDQLEDRAEERRERLEDLYD